MKVLKMVGKVTGIIFLIILILFIIMFVVMTVISKSNDAYKGDKTEILESSDSEAPKALVVYQPSKSTASKDVADQLAAGLQAAGLEVTLTYAGKHIPEDISKYSLVAFGSPVFFGKPSAAVTDTIKRLTDYSEKTVILYSVGQLTSQQELDILKEALKDKKPDFTQKFVTKDNEKEQKAYELGMKAGKECRENE